MSLESYDFKGSLVEGDLGCLNIWFSWFFLYQNLICGEVINNIVVLIQDAPPTNGVLPSAITTTLPPIAATAHSNGISNGHAKLIPDELATAVEMIDNDEEAVENKQQAKKLLDDYFKKQQTTKEKVSKQSESKKKPRDSSNERSVKVSQTPRIEIGFKNEIMLHRQ